MKWLLQKLMQSRDTRGIINRKQGLLNYSLTNQHPTDEAAPSVDAAKFQHVIFNNKPKRVYKANRSAIIGLNDPKRVHTALREFNDLSAGAVFKDIIQAIENQDQDSRKATLNLKGAAAGDKSKRGSILVTKESMEKQAQMMDDFYLNGGAVDDIVANVEMMLQNEKKKNDASARDKKKDNFELDLDKIVKTKSTTTGKPAEQPLVPVTSNNTVSMQKVQSQNTTSAGKPAGKTE